MFNKLKRVLFLFPHQGGNGYINDYPTGRFLRDAKLYEIGSETSEIQRWLIGENQLGIPFNTKFITHRLLL